MNKYMKLAINEAQKGILLGHGEVDDSVLIFSCDVATKIVINKHSLTSLSIFF